jgi:hypothetical protein
LLLLLHLLLQLLLQDLLLQLLLLQVLLMHLLQLLLLLGVATKLGLLLLRNILGLVVVVPPCLLLRRRLHVGMAHVRGVDEAAGLLAHLLLPDVHCGLRRAARRPCHGRVARLLGVATKLVHPFPRANPDAINSTKRLGEITVGAEADVYFARV